ncbi:MAG: valine--tRNA ligase [Schleiferiaceae bacterium]|tara:strand:- start:1701 stop:4316 length:2616 start_codon:yes stop_codon:yes gene_type:complete
MKIASKYIPENVEKSWYQLWLEEKAFSSIPDDRDSFTIVIPPPNVTGVLHMGHMLNNTIQDILVRRARMQGFNACWVPGTDHASIATEAKVVHKLREQGIKKSDLSRDDFLKHAWDWTDKHGGIILEQLQNIGASCDWDRTAFTMDKTRTESVIKVFVDLYNKGYIYRGLRMVHWDPDAKTSVSDEEVIHKDVEAKLFYVKYEIVERPGEYITIATSRPETIMADRAIAINPKDERYIDFHGLNVRIPISKEEIPIILDDYVTTDFGTGCLKVTPAHDWNDYAIGQKHNLEVIDILNADGTLNKKGLQWEGMNRFQARRNIADYLDKNGHLSKIEIYSTSIGTSERTGAIIEPRLSLQWWIKMPELAKPAIKAIEDGEIRLIPNKFKNTYSHWMNNIKDWCISRQLWWGHQIPVYFYGDGEDDFVVATDLNEALKRAKEVSGNSSLELSDLKQDQDCLDTWFSSWIWPISVFDGFNNPDNKELSYYYPTQDLVTAPEILFFWVARMVMAGYEFTQKKPFKNVYLTGIVRDKKGRKMSKSLGNSPDPLDLIKKYGADGVRMGMLLSSPAGNDLPFDEDLCVQGRNFSNKIWNALRLVKGLEVNSSLESGKVEEWSMKWFDEVLSDTLILLENDFKKYRLSEALMKIYKLIWNDFCSWYLELIKPAYGEPISKETYDKSIQFFDSLMKILHPFMPFITEEVWHILGNYEKHKFINDQVWPESTTDSSKYIQDFTHLEELTIALRNFRKEKNLSFKEGIDLRAKEKFPSGISVVQKLVNVTNLGSDWVDSGFSVLAGTKEYQVILSNADMRLSAEEILNIKRELEYLRGFELSVKKKLQNSRFVDNAPEKVVDIERKKLSDTQSKIAALESRLS